MCACVHVYMCACVHVCVAEQPHNSLYLVFFFSTAINTEQITAIMMNRQYNHCNIYHRNILSAITGCKKGYLRDSDSENIGW